MGDEKTRRGERSEQKEGKCFVVQFDAHDDSEFGELLTEIKFKKEIYVFDTLESAQKKVEELSTAIGTTYLSYLRERKRDIFYRTEKKILTSEVAEETLFEEEDLPCCPKLKEVKVVYTVEALSWQDPLEFTSLEFAQEFVGFIDAIIERTPVEDISLPKRILLHTYHIEKFPITVSEGIKC